MSLDNKTILFVLLNIIKLDLMIKIKFERYINLLALFLNMKNK